VTRNKGEFFDQLFFLKLLKLELKTIR